MSKVNKPQEKKLHTSQTNDYNQYWDFKVHFKNSSIVYYFTLSEEISIYELLDYLLERFRIYVVYDIYERDYQPKEYDLRMIEDINNNLDLRRAKAIISKYLTLNPLSKLITFN